MADIRDEILRRRRALRMPQKLLAGAAQVSRSTVQRAERGLPISDESMRALCAVLGITIGFDAPDPIPPAEPLTERLREDVPAASKPIDEGPVPAAPDHQNGPRVDASAPPTQEPPTQDPPPDPLDEEHAPMEELDMPSPQPPARTFLRRSAPLAAPLVLGLALFGLTWALKSGITGAGASYDQMRRDRVERIVGSADLPVTWRSAVRTCATATSVRDCIAVEEASLAAAPALWRDAPPDLRRDCLRSSQDSGQVATALSACLGRDRT